jgi:AcrR family transcriptional regulator
MQHSEHSDKIDSALRDLIAERGWSGVSMAELADRAGIDLATLYDAAASRSRALIDALSRIDHQVLAAGAADAGDTPRDRLFEIMMRRYDALVPWRAALKRLARELPFDPLSLLAVNLAAERAMGRMLEAARLPANGLAGQIRLRGLLAIHLAVLRTFVDDDSPDLSATMKALDGRLKSVERWAEMLERFTPRRASAAAQPHSGAANPVVDDPENANSQPVL